MHFESYDFRHAEEILSQREAWSELRSVIDSVTADEVLAAHEAIASKGRAPAGGQSAINAVFRERLEPLDWKGEPRLFEDSPDLRRWKMDFIKGRIGVEVSFNHAEAVPWTFTRLNIAGESDDVLDDHRIDVGVAMFATDDLKRWAKMDSAVGTFALAKAWLEKMKPIMPIPILVIGLDADGWEATDVFRGTRNYRKPSSN